jgi:hypothetical protein
MPNFSKAKRGQPATTHDWRADLRKVTGQELRKRREHQRRGVCIGCGIDGLPIDHETGFPERYCKACDAARPRNDMSVARAGKIRKKEALDNLDRLMAGKPVEPETT